jgi:acyl-CoA synthetase (AMP-forming)/AMP-acid ligase II
MFRFHSCRFVFPRSVTGNLHGKHPNYHPKQAAVLCRRKSRSKMLNESHMGSAEMDSFRVRVDLLQRVTFSLPLLQTAISGGGSLPTHVDRFFEMIGVVLLNGYGLTETSPVITVRRADRNVRASQSRAPPAMFFEVLLGCFCNDPTRSTFCLALLPA